MSSVYKMDPVMATLPQASLAKIRLDVYPNARKEQAEDYEARVEGMRNSIDIDGLIAPPCLTVHGEGFAAVAGFTRLLALLQLAIMPLAAAANKVTAEDGTVTTKKKDDPTYINISKAADRQRLRDLDPAAYDKVLLETTVPYTPKSVANAQEARIINGVENVVRNDMSPRETAKMYLTILTDKEYPVKAKSLAARFDTSEAKISQYRKIAEFESYLPEFLSTPQEGEKFTEDQLAQLKTTVNTLMADYNRRLGINPTKEEKRNKGSNALLSIDFQHAREFCNRIQPAAGKKPLSRAVALTVFKKFLGWNEQLGKLDDDRETPSFSNFCLQIDNAVKAAGEKDAAATTEAGAAGAAAGTATVGAGTATGTVPNAVPSVSSPNVAQAPVTTTVTGSAMAGQMEASVSNALANAGAGNAVTDAEGVSTDDILDQAPAVPGTGAAGATPGTAPVAGDTTPRQVKAGVAPPVSNKYAKACPPIEMDVYAETLIKLAADDGNRICDVANYLGGASGIYESLRLKDEQAEVDTAYDHYADAVESYIEELEKIREAAMKANLPYKGMKDLVRPTFVVEKEEEVVAATV